MPLPELLRANWEFMCVFFARFGPIKVMSPHNEAVDAFAAGFQLAALELADPFTVFDEYELFTH